MTEKEYIPMFIKKGFTYLKDQQDTKKEFEIFKQIISTLYDTKRDKKTKNGNCWLIYERKNFKIPFFIRKKDQKSSNDFFALYFGISNQDVDLDSVTMISGKLTDPFLVDVTVGILTDNVLENNKWYFSDKTKVRHLPDEATEYNYAFYAQYALQVEYIVLLNELEKKKLYDKLINSGEKMSKSSFEVLYNYISDNSIKKIFSNGSRPRREELKQMIKKHPKDFQISIEKMFSILE